jgi:hypothetical protein
VLIKHGDAGRRGVPTAEALQPGSHVSGSVGLRVPLPPALFPEARHLFVRWRAFSRSGPVHVRPLRLVSRAQVPETNFRYLLAGDAEVVVELRTKRGKPTRYSVVLLTNVDGDWKTVRVYDNDHDEPHMHRYMRSGEKCAAEKIQAPTANDGYNFALQTVKDGYRGMIDGWL